MGKYIVGSKRFYTDKSWILMKILKFTILLLTSPFWFPLFAVLYLADYIEIFLNHLEKTLQKVLDKITPQIK